MKRSIRGILFLAIAFVVVSIFSVPTYAGQSAPPKTIGIVTSDLFNSGPNTINLGNAFTLSTNQVPTTSAKLVVYANDVDEDQGEIDRIYMDGVEVGILSGMNGINSTTIITLSANMMATLSDGSTHQLSMSTPINWSVNIHSVYLIIDGGDSQGDLDVSSSSLNASISGNVIVADLTLGSTTDKTYDIEYALKKLDTSGNPTNQDDAGTSSVTVSANSTAGDQEVLTPSSAFANGDSYQVDAVITSGGMYLYSLSDTVTYTVAPTPTPTPVPEPEVVKAVGTVTISGNATTINAAGMKEAAEALFNSDTDQQVEVVLDVEQNAEAPNAQDVIAISEQSGTKTGMVLELDLSKVTKLLTGETETNTISDSYSLLTVDILLPADLVNKPFYTVYRYHDGVVNELTDIPNEYGEFISIDGTRSILTLHVRKFSTYLVAYADEVPMDDVPKTGEATNGFWYLLPFGLLVVVVLLNKKQGENVY